MTKRLQRAIDERFMRMALSLARRGEGCTSPNPLVGCVLVRDGDVVGWGYHRKCGGAHAEIEALAVAGERARGSIAYVTLEPCAHFGKTPPCAPRLVEAGVARVVAGVCDPNPKVNGGGFRILEDAGIPWECGLLEKECRWINRGFLRLMKNGRPWVTLKAAVSLDGVVALESGESRWISSPESRRVAHLLRAEHDAILVGAGTATHDDPELTVRDVAGRSPRPVLLDGVLSTPLDRRILHRPETIVFCRGGANPDAATALRARGVEVVELPAADGGVDLGVLLAALGERRILSLLVEGGGRTIGAFLASGLADAVSFFVAPRLLGRGRSLAGDFAVPSMEKALDLRDVSRRPVGPDLLIEGRLPCSPDL